VQSAACLKILAEPASAAGAFVACQPLSSRHLQFLDLERHQLLSGHSRVLRTARPFDSETVCRPGLHPRDPTAQHSQGPPPVKHCPRGLFGHRYLHSYDHSHCALRCNMETGRTSRSLQALSRHLSAKSRHMCFQFRIIYSLRSNRCQQPRSAIASPYCRV
jgi:hypothetical protein